MIFNKSSKGNEELRTLTGSYYKSNDFDQIQVKVMLASEDLATLIGQAVYDKAEGHYKSDNYLTGGEHQLLDKLVEHIQLPIAFQATMWHYQGNDISHEDSGRKMKIDADTEKMAWEWMYDRDDAAAMRNYQKAFDRLIKFLNANVEGIDEWKESDARKNSLSLFINSWEHFNRLFAIDNSAVFFLRLAPIMREIERKFIKPVLGADKYSELKAAVLEDNIDEVDKDLYEYICDPIPLLTMSKAVKRFSLSVLPEGVVQNFFSERQTREASTPASLQLVNDVSNSLWADGLVVLNEMKKHWRTMNADETNDDITDMLPGMKSDDKFLSL